MTIAADMARIFRTSFKMVTLGLVFLALIGAAVVQAAPPLVPRQSVSTLTAAQVAAFKPYTHFASTAYCKPANTLAWNCGSMFASIVATVRWCADFLGKQTATPILVSNLLGLVAMVL